MYTDSDIFAFLYTQTYIKQQVWCHWPLLSCLWAFMTALLSRFPIRAVSPDVPWCCILLPIIEDSEGSTDTVADPASTSASLASVGSCRSPTGSASEPVISLFLSVEALSVRWSSAQHAAVQSSSSAGELDCVDEDDDDDDDDVVNSSSSSGLRGVSEDDVTVSRRPCLGGLAPSSCNTPFGSRSSLPTNSSGISISSGGVTERDSTELASCVIDNLNTASTSIVDDDSSSCCLLIADGGSGALCQLIPFPVWRRRSRDNSEDLASGGGGRVCWSGADWLTKRLADRARSYSQLTTDHWHREAV